jgi:hypothetical protein
MLYAVLSPNDKHLTHLTTQGQWVKSAAADNAGGKNRGKNDQVGWRRKKTPILIHTSTGTFSATGLGVTKNSLCVVSVCRRCRPSYSSDDIEKLYSTGLAPQP